MTGGTQVIYGAGTGEFAPRGLSNVALSAGVVVTAGAVLSTNIEDWGGLEGFSEAEFVLTVSAAATDVGDTLDVFVDASNDDGATFINIVHFTQVLGNGGAKKEVAICARAAASIFAPTSDLASGATPRPFIGDRVRVRYVVVDANANSAFSFKVVGSFKG